MAWQSHTDEDIRGIGNMLPFNKQGFIRFLETLLRFTQHYEEKVFSADLQNIATVLMSVTKIKYSVRPR